MTINELFELDQEINLALKDIPDFFINYIKPSKAVRKYREANIVFCRLTYLLHSQGRMKEYTSYTYNAISLRYMELQKASKLKRELEDLIQYNENSNLILSFKKVCKLHDKCKEEVIKLKELLKINKLSELPLIFEDDTNDLF